jgi:hypothetical protein
VTCEGREWSSSRDGLSKSPNRGKLEEADIDQGGVDRGMAERIEPRRVDCIRPRRSGSVRDEADQAEMKQIGLEGRADRTEGEADRTIAQLDGVVEGRSGLWRSSSGRG